MTPGGRVQGQGLEGKSAPAPEAIISTGGDAAHIPGGDAVPEEEAVGAVGGCSKRHAANNKETYP